MHARFFGGDLTSFDEVGHERVVARDLLQVSFVQKVGARIAHLRDEQAFAFEHGCGERGAHAVASDALAGGLHHVVVGCFDRSGEPFGIEMAWREFGKRIHGDLGSDLAAHAIRYGEEWRNDDKAVFIVIAHVANVRAASE